MAAAPAAAPAAPAAAPELITLHYTASHTFSFEKAEFEERLAKLPTLAKTPAVAIEMLTLVGGKTREAQRWKRMADALRPCFADGGRAAMEGCKDKLRNLIFLVLTEQQQIDYDTEIARSDKSALAEKRRKAKTAAQKVVSEAVNTVINHCFPAEKPQLSRAAAKLKAEQDAKMLKAADGGGEAAADGGAAGEEEDADTGRSRASSTYTEGGTEVDGEGDARSTGARSTGSKRGAKRRAVAEPEPDVDQRKLLDLSDAEWQQLAPKPAATPLTAVAPKPAAVAAPSVDLVGQLCGELSSLGLAPPALPSVDLVGQLCGEISSLVGSAQRLWLVKADGLLDPTCITSDGSLTDVDGHVVSVQSEPPAEYDWGVAIVDSAAPPGSAVVVLKSAITVGKRFLLCVPGGVLFDPAFVTPLLTIGFTLRFITGTGGRAWVVHEGAKSSGSATTTWRSAISK